MWKAEYITAALSLWWINFTPPSSRCIVYFSWTKPFCRCSGWKCWCFGNITTTNFKKVDAKVSKDPQRKIAQYLFPLTWSARILQYSRATVVLLVHEEKTRKMHVNMYEREFIIFYTRRKRMDTRASAFQYMII